MDAKQYDEWKRRAVTNEVTRIFYAARASSDFLLDAPAGSSLLREAVLVHVCRLVGAAS